MNIYDETLNKSVDSVPYRLFIEILNEKVAKSISSLYFVHSQKNNFKRKFNCFLDLKGIKFLFVVSLVFFYIRIYNYINDLVNFCFNTVKNLKIVHHIVRHINL